LVNRDNRIYGDTFPPGAFSITSKNSNLTADLKGFDTEVQYDPYQQFIP